MKSGVVEVQAVNEQAQWGACGVVPHGDPGVRSLRWAWRDHGQGLVEYALIIALVAIVVVVALSVIAPTLNSIFRSIPPAL